MGGTFSVKNKHFYPNLGAVEKDIDEGKFTRTQMISTIDWDAICDATIEALVNQSVLNIDIIQFIVKEARFASAENTNTFIELINHWEYILTELLNNGHITQSQRQDSAEEFPF